MPAQGRFRGSNLDVARNRIAGLEHQKIEGQPDREHDRGGGKPQSPPIGEIEAARADIGPQREKEKPEDGGKECRNRSVLDGFSQQAGMGSGAGH
jgi:hypothetical protein